MTSKVKYMLLIFLFIFLALLAYFFVGSGQPAQKMNWGVNFSLKQTDFLGLDDRETYLALLDELKVERIKISVHWDLLEKERNEFDFSELDWQMAEAEKRNVDVILAIGMRTPRWPECHMPNWVRNLDKIDQQQNILKMVSRIVTRYKDSPSLAGWQVENEAFLDFGACPWSDAGFLKQEVGFIKKIDDKHSIILTESGELSLWMRSAAIGDVVGVTTYRTVWQEQFNFYFSYHLPAVFYHRRAEIVRHIFKKEVIGVELQAEPWCRQSIINASLDEQMITFDLGQFYQNVDFAKKTGIDTFYFWGAEWWYWMKTKQNHPEFWEVAKIFLTQ
ncbi:MAG: beta-galactosidase [Candidatus Pacebacteria bacterium]|nr:beta-galactosidase [Candidatus Paceibacterota bacterium]